MTGWAAAAEGVPGGRWRRVAGWLLLACLLGGRCQAAAPPADTLFDDLGGRPAIDGFVGRAVDLYMTDPRLSSFFDNINPDWLKRRFGAFVCHIADGPCPYRGRSMAATHKGLHVDEAAFNAVVEDLQVAMREQGIAFRTQNRLLARLAPMERDIVTR
jgi:hemoglobin